MMSQTKAPAASQRREVLARRLWKACPGSRTATKAKRPSDSHPDPVIPEIDEFAEPEDALVDTVRVVVAAEAPGVTLAGEKWAVHEPGSPK
jgi:hypothetical protein